MATMVTMTATVVTIIKEKLCVCTQFCICWNMITILQTREHYMRALICSSIYKYICARVCKQQLSLHLSLANLHSIFLFLLMFMHTHTPLCLHHRIDTKQKLKHGTFRATLNEIRPIFFNSICCTVSAARIFQRTCEFIFRSSVCVSLEVAQNSIEMQMQNCRPALHEIEIVRKCAIPLSAKAKEHISEANSWN